MYKRIYLLFQGAFIYVKSAPMNALSELLLAKKCLAYLLPGLGIIIPLHYRPSDTYT